MKNEKARKNIIKILLFIEFMSIIFNFSQSKANITTKKKLTLIKDHKCDIIMQYLDVFTNEWKNNLVWYEYYMDQEGNKYPAFCIEQLTEEKIESIPIEVEAEITSTGKDMRNWRILNKGYMGSNYKDWNLQCDDDLYVATKIALQRLIEFKNIEDKYRPINNNEKNEIESRVKKIIEVAKKLYDYGINGKETYEIPKIEIKEHIKFFQEKIDNTLYYIQNYKLESNRKLISYQVKLENFPKETKILNEKNEEPKDFTTLNFKIAIPVNKLQENIIGKIKIENAKIKTNLYYDCLSYGKESKEYKICTFEETNANIDLKIEAKKTNLYINKIDKETKKSIANVTFEIKDEKGNKLQEVTTDKEGIAKIENITEQILIIKEIKAPKEYILSNEEIKVELKWGETTSIVIENERKKEEKPKEPPSQTIEEPKLPRTGF